MKKHTLAAFAASALAALSIGLAAPAVADPSGAGDDVPWWSNSGQTPYGTYQNSSK